MNLKKIEEYLDRFKKYLREGSNHHPSLYKYESVKHWQQHWDLDAPDLAAMYDRSLQNSESRRIWQRENHLPKEVMLKFIALEPDLVRNIFKDLFNEARELVGRVDRFVFHCDQLLGAYKEAHPASIENNHYHNDDYQIISWYLAMRYPEQYAPHYFEPFRDMLELLEVRNIPQSSDFERFAKVCRTLYKMMERDGEVLELHQKRLYRDQFYKENTLLLVEEFYLYSTNQIQNPKFS